MNVLHGDLTRTNGLFLLCVTPLLAHTWIIAVIWRLSEGPQKLGFYVLAAAGYWTVPLYVSALAFWLYELWVVIVALCALVPSWRHSTSGKRFVAFGIGSLLLFLYIGDLLQSELTVAAIYAGAAVMAGLFLLVVWLGLRRHASRPSKV